MKKYFVLLLFAIVIIIAISGCSSSGLFPSTGNAPVITSNPMTSASVGIQYTYQVEASDEDGDTLIFSVATSPDTDMLIDSSTGLISWTPTDEGSYNVTVKVSDGKSTDTQDFTIIVSEMLIPSRVVMAELFVAPACTRCPSAKADMAQLLKKYGFDKLVVLEEYIVNYPLPYSSGWSTSEISQRYFNGYYEYLSSDETGTPDAYFNGLNHSVHHDGSSYANYEAAIEAELTKSPKVAISASYDVNGSTVNISGRINNISSETLSNIAVEAMVYEDDVPLVIPDTTIDTVVNHVVRDIITHDETGGEELIDSFAPGDSYEFSLTSSSLSNVHDMSNIHVVVYVQAPNSPTKEILQALYVE